MHELSIAHGIVEAVEAAVGAAACATRPATVRRVGVRVGALSGVVPDALLFCFDVVTRGTPLDGAALEIERVPVALWCPDCAATRELAEAPPFRCPRCDRPSADLRRGRELELAWYELDDDDPDRVPDAGRAAATDAAIADAAIADAAPTHPRPEDRA